MSTPAAADSSFTDPEAMRAASVLSAIGYSVAEVPRARTPTCDLKAKYDGESLLVEVKTFGLPKADRGRHAREEHLQIERQTARSRNIAKTLSWAAHQIKATISVKDDALEIAWVAFDRPGDIARSLECFCTLYGVRWFRILSGPLRTSVNIIPVFFADRSWFRAHPEVCALVEEAPSGLSLRVNPAARYRAELEASRLHRVLSKLGGVFDLPTLRDRLQIYVADDTCVEPTEAEVTKSLLALYGIAVERFGVTASSTVWPGNEMGSYSPVPGWDIRVRYLDWLEWLAAHGV